MNGLIVTGSRSHRIACSTRLQISLSINAFTKRYAVDVSGPTVENCSCSHFAAGSRSDPVGLQSPQGKIPIN